MEKGRFEPGTRSTFIWNTFSDGSDHYLSKSSKTVALVGGPCRAATELQRSGISEIERLQVVLHHLEWPKKTSQAIPLEATTTVEKANHLNAPIVATEERKLRSNKRLSASTRITQLIE
jgi:hypothetical protein